MLALHKPTTFPEGMLTRVNGVTTMDSKSPAILQPLSDEDVSGPALPQRNSRQDPSRLRSTARAPLAAAPQPTGAPSHDPPRSQNHAHWLARAMGREDIAPQTTGQARLGDIRHCIADIGRITRELGYAPKRDFAEGLAELAAWVAEQQAVDRVAEARRELEARGLVA